MASTALSGVTFSTTMNSAAEMTSSSGDLGLWLRRGHRSTPSVVLAVFDGGGRWSSAGRWLPGLPACRWLRLRDAGQHRGQRPSGLVDPRSQEPPVPPGCQRLVLGVHGCQQLLEQAVDLSGPGSSPVVGGALGQQLPAAHEVAQGGPQRRPRQGPFTRRLGGQDRRQLGACGGAGVLLKRTGLSVPGRFLADLQSIQPAMMSPATRRISRVQPRVPNPPDSAAAGVPAAAGVEVGVSASAEVAGRVVGEVGRSAEVGVRVGDVLVRVGRVGAVAVTLGSGRAADSSPSPAPQPLSPRSRPRTSLASNHALPARRPRIDAPSGRSLFLVADGIRRDSIQDVRIDDHLRISQGRRGDHARQATPAILRPESIRGITQSG